MLVFIVVFIATFAHEVNLGALRGALCHDFASVIQLARMIGALLVIPSELNFFWLQVSSATGLILPMSSGLQVSSATGLILPMSSWLQVSSATGLILPMSSGLQVSSATGLILPMSSWLQFSCFEQNGCDEYCRKTGGHGSSFTL